MNPAFAIRQTRGNFDGQMLVPTAAYFDLQRVRAGRDFLELELAAKVRPSMGRVRPSVAVQSDISNQAAGLLRLCQPYFADQFEFRRGFALIDGEQRAGCQ